MMLSHFCDRLELRGQRDRRTTPLTAPHAARELLKAPPILWYPDLRALMPASAERLVHYPDFS